MTLPAWFGGYALGFFERWVRQYAGRPDVHVLQVGAYTGDATVWMMENAVTDPTSTVTDIDVWDAEQDYFGAPLSEVEQLYDERTAKWVEQGRVVKFKGTSDAFFDSTPREPRYDFIYIDGDHSTVGVLQDAVAAYPRLKVGGLMGFDDYQWLGGAHALERPGPAIDAFRYLYADRMQVVELGLQVWMRRTA